MEKILEFELLRKLAEHKGYSTKFADLIFYDGLLKGDKIGLRATMHDEEFIKILSHEIAHAYLHCDRGDMVHNPDPEAEKSADRAGEMLTDAIELQNDMFMKRLQQYRDSNERLIVENQRLRELLQQNHIEA